MIHVTQLCIFLEAVCLSSSSKDISDAYIRLLYVGSDGLVQDVRQDSYNLLSCKEA